MKKNNDTKSTYNADYQNRFIKRYVFKLNQKTEDLDILSLWRIIPSKTAFIKWAIKNFALQYLDQEVGMKKYIISAQLHDARQEIMEEQDSME